MEGQIISKAPELDESEIKALIEVSGKSVNWTYRLSGLPLNSEMIFNGNDPLVL